MTRSKTEKTPEQTASADEQYQNGLTELTEKKKLGLLAQDEYDQLHRELVKKVYGDPSKED